MSVWVNSSISARLFWRVGHANPARLVPRETVRHTNRGVTYSMPVSARAAETRARRSSRRAADTRAAASTSCCRRSPPAFGRLLPQTRGRHLVAGAERVVEPAQAREAAGERDLGHGQRGLGQQLLGQEQPARQQQLDRRHAELLLDDAADLPRAELELSAISSSPARSSRCPSSSRWTISWAIRCASSTGALPGASSGRQRRHGRKPACSVSWACRRTGSWLPSAFSPGRSAGSRCRSTSRRRRRRRRTVDRARRAPCRACVRRVPWIVSLCAEPRPGQPFSDITRRTQGRVQASENGECGPVANVSSCRNKEHGDDHGKSRQRAASRLQVGGLSGRAAEAGGHRSGLAGILWETERPGRVRLSAPVEEPSHPVLVEAERQLA